MSGPMDEILKKIPGAALRVVGFAARVTISFFVILWVYAFLTVEYIALVTLPWPDIPGNPLLVFAGEILAGLVFACLSFEDFACSLNPSSETCFPASQASWPYPYIALAAVLVAAIWGRICLRRCGPASGWF
jgi:hypothetical protein